MAVTGFSSQRIFHGSTRARGDAFLFMGLSPYDGLVCSPGAWAINPESPKAYTAPTVSCCCPAISVWPAVPCLMAVRNSPILYLGSRPFLLVSQQPPSSPVQHTCRLLENGFGLQKWVQLPLEEDAAREAISGMPTFSDQSTVKSRPVDDVGDTETWLEIPLLCLCGSVLCCILSVYKLSHKVLFIILQDWSWMDFVTLFPLCMCS